jgi:TetR/AcrR family transcriptional regulator, transcriptional repressor for nem operon
MAGRSPNGDAGDTAERILDVAERLVQTRGFNGFSYADIAGELGMTKAALHYHFAGKAELGEALVTRYAERFAAALAAVASRGDDGPTALRAYADLYRDVVREGRMCLCGMLAAEYQTLPEPMRTAVARFIDDNETWLTGVLRRGRADGTLAFEGPPADAARMIVGSFEGAMLLARPFGDVRRFETAANSLLSGLRSHPRQAGGQQEAGRQAGGRRAAPRRAATPRSG